MPVLEWALYFVRLCTTGFPGPLASSSPLATVKGMYQIINRSGKEWHMQGELLNPEVAILDDMSLTLRAWKRKLGVTVIVHVFLDPADFWKKSVSEAGFIARLACVVTDFYFADGSEYDGMSFSEELRLQYAGPILLSSDGEFDLQKKKNWQIDKVISKDPVDWSDLQKIIAETVRTA